MTFLKYSSKTISTFLVYIHTIVTLSDVLVYLKVVKMYASHYFCSRSK